MDALGAKPTATAPNEYGDVLTLVERGDGLPELKAIAPDGAVRSLTHPARMRPWRWSRDDQEHPRADPRRHASAPRRGGRAGRSEPQKLHHHRGDRPRAARARLAR